MYPLSPSSRRGESSAAFTLIELLVVIAIMAILTASLGPGLLRSFRDSNLTQAGNRIADLTAAARQDALNHNAMTAVMLVTNCGWDQTLSGRALTVLQLQEDGTWNQTRAWLILPTGTRAYDDPTAATGLPTVSGTAPVLKLTGRPLDAASCSAFVFTPDGSLYGEASSSRTAYIQFATDPAPSPAGNRALRNYYDLVFSTDTGGAHVVRR